MTLQENRKAAFLDRDGVVNYDKQYVHKWADFEFLPGAIEGLKLLGNAGYKLFIITNQSGLARGLFPLSDYFSLTKRYVSFLANQGIRISGVYHCPHHPKGTVKRWTKVCDCRKPAPGLILQAKQDHGLVLGSSILIGDKPSDIQAAQAAGVGRAFLVNTNSSDKDVEIERVELVDGLFDCAKRVVFDKSTT